MREISLSDGKAAIAGGDRAPQDDRMVWAEGWQRAVKLQAALIEAAGEPPAKLTRD